MANALYPPWKQALLGATANSAITGSGTTGLYAALVTAGYTYSAAHDFYNDLGANVVGTDQEITSPTLTSGTVDGNNVTFTAVSGAQCTAIVIYRKNAGANTTWYLCAYLDTGQTGLPVTPNGGDITITWDAAGIFTL